MDWLRILINTAKGVGGLAGVALGLLYLLQNKIIYVPRLPGLPADYPYQPDAFSMLHEDVWLTTADGVRLHAWLMCPPHWGPEERRQRLTVVFFQENAGNMAYRLHFLKQLTRVLDCNAFILSYRGYGRSQGSPTEKGLQLDAEAAMRHILSRTDIDATRVVLFGRSLGGAVATYAACQYSQHVAGLILENTFSSVLEIVPHTMPFLRPLIGPSRPFNFLLRNRWDTKGRLKQLQQLPLLFLSSLQDEMLPAYQMRELYELHPEQPWTITYFPDGRHLDAYDALAAQYWPAVQHFVDRLQPAQPFSQVPGQQAADPTSPPAPQVMGGECGAGEGQGQDGVSLQQLKQD